MKSVKWVLLSLNPVGYVHVVVRQHTKTGIDYLGGGLASDIVDRFGDRLVECSNVVDNILCLYVK